MVHKFSIWKNIAKVTEKFCSHIYKVKAPIAGRLRKCHSIFYIYRSKCDAESRIAAIILMYVSSLL